MFAKIILLSCGMLFFLQAGAMGQVRLGVTVPRRSFVLGEPIMATLTLQNQSMRPLVVDRDHYNAELFVEVSGGSLGRRNAPVRRRVYRDFVIMPNASIRDVVEITSLYEYLGPGNYQLNVVMHYEDRSFYSEPFAFDIVSGLEMRSFRQMLPDYSDIELIYSFRYATREGREEAFMVIQSADGRSLYGTFSLGPLLRLYRPVIRARDDGSVVVVHQSGHNRFSRSIFMVERTGAMLIEQRHFRPDGTPIRR